ncbi:hypothetical protein [Ktedonobacter robiniae]|uniref:hypothetical protein n=1 Tax=Ktedonobacter robiniae TaxID=2778365 RepID=UPI001914E8A0|nr:hypothetical protein [Ktedonobacter robiniae]
MLEPHSSRKTSSFVGSFCAFSHHVARSSALRSVAPIDFFSRPAQPFDDSTHGPPAHPFPLRLLPHGTVLFQRRVDMRL